MGCERGSRVVARGLQTTKRYYKHPKIPSYLNDERNSRGFSTSQDIQ